jgi:cupin superfamily acireductone dioxygenase involved in methionine salvage
MRKKSIKLAVQTFVTNVDEIIAFTQRSATAAPLNEQDKSWCYDLAIIRVYREFEDLMLSCLVALINNDSTTFSQLKKRTFPKHMNVEVCEYLICGDGYFDFAGRDGLLKTIKNIVPNRHWLPNIVGDATYTAALKKLSALRNFAAHDSSVSKKRALEAIGQKRMSSSGAWLKKQNRFVEICNSLKAMARKIDAAAPH